MYITARPFLESGKTYLDALRRGATARALTFFLRAVFLSVPVVSEITRFHLNYNRARARAIAWRDATPPLLSPSSGFN